MMSNNMDMTVTTESKSEGPLRLLMKLCRRGCCSNQVKWFGSSLSDQGAEKDWQLETLWNLLRPVCCGMTSLSDLFGHPIQHCWEARTTNKQAPEKMTRHVTSAFRNNGLPYMCIRQNLKCISVRWWRVKFVRLQRHTSYSHADTLQMKRQVMQAYKSGRESSSGTSIQESQSP